MRFYDISTEPFELNSLRGMLCKYYGTIEKPMFSDTEGLDEYREHGGDRGIFDTAVSQTFFFKIGDMVLVTRHGFAAVNAGGNFPLGNSNFEGIYLVTDPDVIGSLKFCKEPAMSRIEMRKGHFLIFSSDVRFDGCEDLVVYSPNEDDDGIWSTDSEKLILHMNQAEVNDCWDRVVDCFEFQYLPLKERRENLSDLSKKLMK